MQAKFFDLKPTSESFESDALSGRVRLTGRSGVKNGRAEACCPFGAIWGANRSLPKKSRQLSRAFKPALRV